MVRSLYSGVSGMKAHQTKMDVIGNNISNVNTYGFKSSRVTFRDVYYQSMRNASEGSGNRGGTNPSQVGYGATTGSVDVNHSQSIMQTTGSPLDTAITGEGFFQVQDADGNMFYTKAGMLNIDSAGNLVDVNGNFVLGVSGDPMGKPSSSNRIQLAVPSVSPTVATYTEKINEIGFTVSSSNETSDANITLSFMSTNDLPVGQKASAKITSSGISISLNAKETFATIADLNTEINRAITAANGGVEHPGGEFTVEMDPADKFSNLTGAEIAGTDFGITEGKVTLPDAWKDILSVSSVGEKFSGEGMPTFTVEKVEGSGLVPPVEDVFNFTVAIAGGGTYTGKLTASQMESSGELLLSGTGLESGDSITIKYPNQTTLEKELNAAGGTPILPDTSGTWTSLAGTIASIASTPTKDLGLGGSPFKLKEGTEGGAQTVEDLNGIGIGADGIIMGNHPVHGLLELGRIDLVTFANAQGLTQSGSTYFTQSANSGTPTASKAGEGGTGALAGGALEMSNVDLSNEFADMITTQRGFQANSRLITVSDTMLEELINLKR